MFVAQTNIQLYNQLRGQDRSLEELERVQKAYEFVTTLYGSHLQSDGKPFLSHIIGVASIVSQLGTSIEPILAALAHNAYGNGDFGDGLNSSTSKRRRRMITAALGDAAEALVLRFPRYRLTSANIGEVSAKLDSFNETERTLLLIDLADQLEKYVDLGVLYYGDGAWARDIVSRQADELCNIARRLHQPALASGLAKAFETVSAEERLLEGRLRTLDGRRHPKLTIPRSCRQRLIPYLVSRLQKWGRRA